ncbi:hypothetical protein B0H10DRAFT_2238085 [Mycena sp. CBHHK59/15]|nr:hypothetical protein B0H10DRAFT_2238085 [Mycena sp. CBHHK59/15]
MAKGHLPKKLKTQRKIKQARLDKQYDLHSAAAHVQTAAFLACHELILYHLLEACSLASMIALSHTSHLFRTLVKALFRIRLLRLVELFIGPENTEEFFRVLQLTGSAIGGSTLPLALVPPTDDEIDEWTPNNLNIYVPHGNGSDWESFFTRIDLPPTSTQPGVSHPYHRVTNHMLNILLGLL